MSLASAWRAAYDASQPAQSIPQEATDAMYHAGMKEIAAAVDSDAMPSPFVVWKAMHDAAPVTAPAEPPKERKALEELVACEDLRVRMAALAEHGLCLEGEKRDASLNEYTGLQEAYTRHNTAAWANARAVLKQRAGNSYLTCRGETADGTNSPDRGTAHQSAEPPKDGEVAALIERLRPLAEEANRLNDAMEGDAYIVAREKMGILLHEGNVLLLLNALARLSAPVPRLVVDRLSAAAPVPDIDVAQDDLREILRAVGLSDCARPYSPHEVVQRELLPHLRALRTVIEKYDGNSNNPYWAEEFNQAMRIARAHLAWSAARAYLNEKPHELLAEVPIDPKLGVGVSPPHAAAEPEKPEMNAATANPYWLIERGSPAEWWVRGMPEEWTTDASKAAHFTEWGAKRHAKRHAKELEQPPFNIKGPLRATEHIDCDGPAAEPEKPMTNNGRVGTTQGSDEARTRTPRSAHPSFDQWVDDTGYRYNGLDAVKHARNGWDAAIAAPAEPHNQLVENFEQLTAAERAQCVSILDRSETDYRCDTFAMILDAFLLGKRASPPAQPTKAEGQPIGTLWQHGETGRKTVEFADEPQTATHWKGWHPVGALYLASPSARPIAREPKRLIAAAKQMRKAFGTASTRGVCIEFDEALAAYDAALKSAGKE